MKWLNRTCRVTAAAVAASLMMGAGCPNGNLLDQLGGLLDQLPVDQQQLLDLVNQFFSSAAGQDISQLFSDPNLAPSDAQPAFGEDPGLYQASPDQVDFPEDPVFSAVGPSPGSAPPLHGRLVGRFWNDQPDSDSGSSPGVFRGQWFDADGRLSGYIRGHYRPAPADELPDGLAAGGIFRGRYVDLDGRFRGFIFGRYGRKADSEQGMFAGRWVGRDGQELGELRGRWIDDPQANGGTFGGRWAAFDVCNESNDLPPGDPNAQAAQSTSDDLNTDLGQLMAFVDQVADPNDVPQGDFPLDAVGDPELENPDHLPCADLSGPFGVLRGVWESYDPNDPPVPNPNADGIMFGRWRNIHGGETGGIIGVWAYDPASGSPDASAQDAPQPEGRFFAYIIDESGAELGWVRGRFGRSPRGLGVFRGEMFDGLSGKRVGAMRGRWISDGNGQGHIAGIWNAPGVEDTPGGPGVPPPGDGGSQGPDSPGDGGSPDAGGADGSAG